MSDESTKKKQRTSGTSITVDKDGNTVETKGKVITYAVAGDGNTRNLRARVVQKTCPKLDNRVATAGVGVHLPFEMRGAKKKAVINNTEGIDVNSIDSIEKIETEPGDTVLIIGQVSTYVKRDDTSLLSGIKESPVYVMGGTNDDDFNISTAGITALKETKCKIKPTASIECPMYKWSEWETLLSKYEAVAIDIHNIAVAAFLTSRRDGAFYRQFGLAKLAADDNNQGTSIMKFELNLATKIQELAQDSKIFHRNLIVPMNKIIAYCKKADNATPSYQADKNGGKEKVYVDLYPMWNNALNANTHPDLMTPLTKLILEAKTLFLLVIG